MDAAPPVPVASASLIYLNVRSLMVNGQKDKVGYLELLAKEEKALIIAVSETWLHDGVEDAEVHIKDYNIIRSDRSGKGGGGLCLYVHISITPVVLLRYSNSICEGLVIRVPEHNTIYFAVYRPPYFKDTDVEAFNLVLEELTNCLNESTNQAPGCNILTGFGDFNLPKLNWFSEGFPQAPGKSGNEHEIYKAFLEFAQDNFLLQMITSPTRGNNILDLILTNNGICSQHIKR